MNRDRLLNASLLNALQGLPGCALVNLMCLNCVVLVLDVTLRMALINALVN